MNSTGTDVDRQIARSTELLRRQTDSGRSLARRARARRYSGIGLKARRIAIALVAILVGAFIWGMVTPIGSDGLLYIMALMVLAVMLFAFLPTVPEVRRETLGRADLHELPLQTEIWLESQRKALPAPAIRILDDIGERLGTLGPQLQELSPDNPAAPEIRRLLADHLPELVSGYQKVPEPLRRQERNGRVPEQQLVEGLSVIDRELATMSEQLAVGDLDALATHNRFLELKYQEAKALGEE